MSRQVLARTIPFAVFIAFIALDGVLAQVAAWAGIDDRWLYAIRIGAVIALLAWFWPDYVELNKGPAVSASDWLLAVALGIAVFVLWINLNVPLLSIGQGAGFDPREAGRINWALSAFRLIGAALVVPVMEELFWRSFVLRWIQKHDFLQLDPANVGLKAIAVSSVLFALEHHLWFAGLLAGLAYAWLYVRTGNLWVPVVAHATTNLLLGAYVLYTGAWEFW